MLRIADAEVVVKGQDRIADDCQPDGRREARRGQRVESAAHLMEAVTSKLAMKRSKGKAEQAHAHDRLDPRQIPTDATRPER